MRRRPRTAVWTHRARRLFDPLYVSAKKVPGALGLSLLSNQPIQPNQIPPDAPHRVEDIKQASQDDDGRDEVVGHTLTMPEV